MSFIADAVLYMTMDSFGKIFKPYDKMFTFIKVFCNDKSLMIKALKAYLNSNDAKEKLEEHELVVDAEIVERLTTQELVTLAKRSVLFGTFLLRLSLNFLQMPLQELET